MYLKAKTRYPGEEIPLRSTVQHWILDSRLASQIDFELMRLQIDFTVIFKFIVFTIDSAHCSVFPFPSVNASTGFDSLPGGVT